ARVRRQARVRIDLEDREPAVRVDSKVHPRVAFEAEHLPALDRELRRPRRELGLDSEAARRRTILEARGFPLGRVTDDARLAFGESVELDLGDRQRADAPGRREQRDVELAPRHEALREPLAAPLRALL